jgi:integrase
MGHVEDRWYRVVDGVREATALCGQGRRYRVRYTAPDGSERSKSFADREKRSAEAFLVSVESDKLRGSYIDPRAGRITFKEYADSYVASRTYDESTREATESRLRVHVHPTLGARELGSLRPNHIREWDRALQERNLAPTYRRVLFANVSAILSAAVDDERIARNPCRAASVRAPRPVSHRIEPWTVETVLAVRAAVVHRYRIAVALGAGCGLRQGEIFGLAVEDVDFLRGMVHIRRQVKIVRNRLIFGPPKGRKVRVVPLPESVAFDLAAHIEAFPPVDVELPWETPSGALETARPVLYSREHKALNRNYINSLIWKPALEAAGVEPTRANGMHALRHFYASTLLDAGESIKAVSEYLGHADAGFTLRTYTHLMPNSEERTRKAVDRVLLSGKLAADGLVTAWTPR